MPEVTLERVERGRYTLGDMGTLRTLRRFGAEIEAAGTAWTLRRAGLGFGQTIIAVDSSTGERVARYRPSGLLRVRGVYRGTISVGERELDWQANHQMGSHFTLRESGDALAEFDAGSDARPVSMVLYGLRHLEALPLLFCCYIVKQVVDATMTAGSPGAPVPPSDR
jgi:hypothetical protein